MSNLEYRQPRRVLTGLLRSHARTVAGSSSSEPKARITGRLSLKSANTLRPPAPDDEQG